MRIGLIRLVLVSLVLTAVAERLPAEVIRAGTEFQANAYSLASQSYPAVAVDDDFDFVVVWQSYGRDGSAQGVFGRRFNSDGASLGSDFQVTSYTTGNQVNPAVTFSASGSFVVTWTSYQDGSGAGVFARRFDSGGVAQATEFLVNNHTLGSQSGPLSPPGPAGPAIAAESNGDFAVVWHDLGGDGNLGGIFGRRFDATGTALGTEFQVNVYTTNAQTYPSVSLDGDGDFVVTWQSYNQDGNLNGIFARRFASSGAAVAGEFQVNARTIQSQRYPSVSLETNGDFVVAWQSYNQDGQNYGIFGRRFASTGTGLAVEFLVNTYTESNQRYPSVAMAGDGDFVVVWQSYGQDGYTDGIFARRFNDVGNATGPDFQVNSHTEEAQFFAAIGTNLTGDFVVAWESDFQDGSNRGIFAQRFDNVAVLDIDANGATEPLTDGVLVLRYLFGFTGTTLVSGAFDAVNCQRCDATAIKGYLDTLI